MPSNQEIQASYFDGKTAKRHAVLISNGAFSLEIKSVEAETLTLSWPYEGLIGRGSRMDDSPEITVSHVSAPEARLRIRDQDFILALSELAPQLTKSAHNRRMLKISLIAGVLIWGLVTGAYFFFTPATALIAQYIPLSWRTQVGTVVQEQLIKKGQACPHVEAQEILHALAERLNWPASSKEPLTITIWKTSVVNAFALPGNHVLVTTGILKDIQSPDELAGIFAHEIGHALKRHPTQQLIRVAGLLPLVSLMFGQGSGITKTLGEAGILLTLLRYTRAGENEADQTAITLLNDARINPTALADFFKRRIEKSKLTAKGSTPQFLDILRTHPRPQARVDSLRADPNIAYRPALSDGDWQVLKTACTKR